MSNTCRKDFPQDKSADRIRLNGLDTSPVARSSAQICVQRYRPIPLFLASRNSRGRNHLPSLFAGLTFRRKTATLICSLTEECLVRNRDKRWRIARLRIVGTADNDPGIVNIVGINQSQ
jgi:hypothetical protein